MRHDTIPAPPDTLPDTEVPPWFEFAMERASDGSREAVAICQEVLREVRMLSSSMASLTDELRGRVSSHDEAIAELQGRMDTMEREMAEMRDDLQRLVGPR